MKLEKLVGVIAVCLFLLMLIPYVKASVSCHKEYYINGTAYINDTCVLNDEELEEDVYGTTTGSGSEDIILQYIEDQLPDEDSDGPSVQSESEDGVFDEIGDICNDPAFADYFDGLSSIPPEDFIEEMKGLGYDDEAHIAMIWTMCQNEYINNRDESWSTDHSGIDSLTVASLIGRAVDWLLGKNAIPSKNEEIIGRKLDSYFASDKDVYYLDMKIRELELRLEALERTIEETEAEAYCQGKLGLMLDYNMRWVKCGDTKYHNHLIDPTTGEEIVIGITPIENGGSEESEEIELEVEEDNTIECSDVGKPKNSVSFCTSYTGNYWCGFSDKDAWYMKNCIRKV